MLRKILIACLVSWLFTKPAFAADDLPNRQEFATSYDVIYDVGEDGISEVTEKISLKNLTSQYYASEFKLSIGASQIFDVKAADSQGPLEVTVEKKETSSQIQVKFNQQVAGLGKTLPWTLHFKSKDFAQNLGKVWEVRAPRIAASGNLETYTLTLAVPQSFGEPTNISPTPKSQTRQGGKQFLTFERDQLKTSGVFASFGKNQLFDFDLTYHLENTSWVPVLTNIVLPSDTPYQDVLFQKIDPAPLNVTIDEDGNYLAWYKISRMQKLDVKVFGSAKLYTNSKINNPALDENLRKKYLRSGKYWEKDNPQITNKLNEIFGSNPPKNTEEKVRLIYHYVVNSLKYDSSRLGGNIERLGAIAALNNPTSAVCMEFTDLFITLSRAANIPARELDGYAYTSNTTLRPLSLTKDILHSWPEYFDEKRGWVMVDPTWENTTEGVDYFSKLDLNHFTFVTKGISSTQPVPAGSYKYKNADSHDVKVTLSENDFLGKGQIDVQIDTPDTVLAGFPGKIKIKVINFAGSLFNSQNLSIQSSQINILDKDDQTLGPIPPFGTATFDLNLRTKSIFDEYQDQIVVLVGSQKFTKDITIKPFILFQTVPMIATGILLAMVAIYFLVLGGLLYRRKVIRIPQK